MVADEKKQVVSCKDRVMGEIKSGRVCPISRRFFQTRECFVWAFWGVSVVVGAFAVAVVLFVLVYQHYAVYEVTHDTFFTFILHVLPYAWILIFICMALFAIYNLRHTKNGYRYPLWQIVCSSIVFSVLGGVALHGLGFGFLLDHTLGKHMEGYVSLHKYEYRMWQNPAEGRLLGQVIKEGIEENEPLRFRDVAGKEWRIDTTEIDTEVATELFGGHKVRLLGVMSTSTDEFYICEVLPWMLHEQLTHDQYEKVRERTLKKMRTLKQQKDTEGQIVAVAGSPCVHTPFLQRMR